MHRTRLWGSLLVVAALASACSDDPAAGTDPPTSDAPSSVAPTVAARGACETREKEPVPVEGEGGLDIPPLDALFSHGVTFARVSLTFEERTSISGSSDALVFRAELDEVLLPSAKDDAVPTEFRVLTTIDADLCPDERILDPGVSAVATIDQFTLLARPDIDWWLATAWLDTEAADYVSPIQPSADDLSELYGAYDRADLPEASRTEIQLAWAAERRAFQLVRGAEENSLYGPIELALGAHHDQLGEIHLDRSACGTQLALVDEEERAALVLTPATQALAISGDLPARSAAVGGSWNIQVFLGTNLLEGWCSDIVIENPTAHTDHIWPATAGEVEFFGPTNGVAVVRITGLVVEPPNGVPYQFDDLEIRHNCWLCVIG